LPKLLNNLLSSQLSGDLNIITLNPLLYLILFLVTIGVSTLGVLLPLRKILRSTPINAINKIGQED
jgi:ABC-type antimicrobial peptide transport system permease subunit